MKLLLGKLIEIKYITDEQGRPYFEHCLHVMQTCGLTDEISLCIALGHNLLEDCPNVTYQYLTYEFGYIIAEGINQLTLKIGNYDDYIKAIPLNPQVGIKCTKIKLADLRHNMDASRLNNLTKKDFDRMEKYMKAYTYLKSI